MILLIKVGEDTTGKHINIQSIESLQRVFRKCVLNNNYNVQGIKTENRKESKHVFLTYC